ILRTIAGVTCRAAVAHADVQIAVRSELQLPAVVVRERLRDAQQDPRGRRIGAIRIRLRHPIAGDDGGSRSGRLRVVDEEEAVLLVMRMKRDAEETALAAAEGK